MKRFLILAAAAALAGGWPLRDESAHTLAAQSAPSSRISTATYVVGTDGAAVYAYDGRTGSTVYSHADLSIVLQYLVDRMAFGGCIALRVGTYRAGATVTLPYDKSFTLRGEVAGSRPYAGSSGVRIDVSADAFIRLSAYTDLQAGRSPKHVFENLQIAHVVETTPTTIILNLSTYSHNVLREVRIGSNDATPDPSSIGIQIAKGTDNSGAGHVLEAVGVANFGTCLKMVTSHASARDVSLWNYERRGLDLMGYNNFFQHVNVGNLLVTAPATDRVAVGAYNNYTGRCTQNKIDGLFAASGFTSTAEYLFDAGGGYLLVESLALEGLLKNDPIFRKNLIKKRSDGTVILRNFWFDRKFESEGAVGGTNVEAPPPLALASARNSLAAFNGGNPILASKAVCSAPLGAGRAAFAPVTYYGYCALLNGGKELRPLRAFVEHVTKTDPASGKEVIVDDLPVQLQVVDQSKSVLGTPGVDFEFKLVVTPLKTLAEQRTVLVRIEFD